jgi:hypothetical protein
MLKSVLFLALCCALAVIASPEQAGAVSPSDSPYGCGLLHVDAAAKASTPAELGAPDAWQSEDEIVEPRVPPDPKERASPEGKTSVEQTLVRPPGPP